MPEVLFFSWCAACSGRSRCPCGSVLALLTGLCLSSVSAYHLPFDYNPHSPTGPTRWKRVDVTGNEWEQFVGKELIDLDIDGNECGSTRRPAPVHLIANQKCEDNHEILTRKIRETDCGFHNLTWSITPHSLRATFPHDDSTCIRPTIDLPNGYPYRWHAYFVEVHLRSEHVIDGRRFDGEMQMVHLGQVDQKRELSTISVLLDATGEEDNPKLQMYIDKWQEVVDRVQANCKESTRKLRNSPTNSRARGLRGRKTRSRMTHRFPERGNRTYRFKYWNRTAVPRRAALDPEHREGCNGRALETTNSNMTNVGSLTFGGNSTNNTEPVVLAPRRKGFPYDIWPTIYFYRYRGQITYPPCSEIVSWRVLDEPLLISRRQFKQLARLLESYVDEDDCKNDSNASPKGETFRPLQQFNPKYQNISHCTEKDFTFWMYKPHQV